MLYNYNFILQFCLATRKLYSSTLTFCLICKLGQDIINFNSLPLSLLSNCTTQSTCILLVAAIEQGNVNVQIQNASLRPYASTNALSTRNLGCTM